jgi:histidinol-phosphate aminotransferase
MQEHGGLDWKRLLDEGRTPSEILDFSVNVNPFGPCPGVYRALESLDPAQYPDLTCHELGMRLAQLNEVKEDEILIGNGTAELIWLAAHAWLSGRRAVILTPTFGEYARAAQAVGGEVILLAARPPTFRWEVEKICDTLPSVHPALVFLCNPNNPSGVCLTDEEIEKIARASEPGLLVLDEAYRSFVSYRPFAPPPAENVLVLRSMTKDFGLAGLRLGYALGTAQTIAQLRTFQPPWSVGSPAQAAGLAALTDLDYLHKTCVETRRLAIDFRTELANLGAKILPSDTPYCLIDVQALGTAKTTYERLLTRNIQVRDCTSFELPTYIRVATRRQSDNQRLLDAWTETFPGQLDG